MSAPVTYVVELWYDVWREILPLWQGHWEEIAVHHDAVPLDPDLAEYERLQSNGMLSMLIARSEGRVIGYHVSIIKPHLHYRSTLHAFTDVYYVIPEFRKGRTGIRLFQAAEREWMQRGVVKAFTATKLHLDMSAVLEFLGWQHDGEMFTKLMRGPEWEHTEHAFSKTIKG